MDIYRLKVTLQGVTFPVWRRIEMSADTTLDVLHGVVQTAMGWKDTRQHLFIMGHGEYGVADPEFGGTVRDERQAVLGQVAKQGGRFVYVYDFNEEWEHDILVERASFADSLKGLPYCIGGEHACPPEGCGGPRGYQKLLNSLDNLPGSPDAGTFELPEGFDPAAFDAGRVNEWLFQFKEKL